MTGNVVGNKDLEIEGNVQKNVGKAQAGFGDAKEKVKDVVEGD